jgi:ABC-type sulfate/molybdate transport systems ATPase subunit
VALEVQPGEFLTLLGPSGCGKTTTLRMIAGYEMPDAGRILFDGQDVTGLPANQRNIGFVFQNYALFPHLSIFENVAYGLRVRAIANDEVGRRVGEVLSLVGLAGYEQQFSSQLSGGEQQRRAGATRHPAACSVRRTAVVSTPARVECVQIRDLQQRLAITTVYVTHDQEEAMAVSDRIVVMNQEASSSRVRRRISSSRIGVRRALHQRVNLIAGRRRKRWRARDDHALGATIVASSRGRLARATRSCSSRARRPSKCAPSTRRVAFTRPSRRVPRREDRIPARRGGAAAGRPLQRRTGEAMAIGGVALRLSPMPSRYCRRRRIDAPTRRR